MKQDKMREAVHKYIDQVDGNVLNMIHTMLKEYTSHYEISDADAQELEKRYRGYKEGKGKSYTAAEAKAELRKRIARSRS
jgi:hypothetical protein